MTYKFHYRKPDQWFYRTLTLVGHRYVADLDKIIFSLKDGTIYELPNASKIEVRFGKDMLDVMNKAQTNDNVPRPQSQDQQ
jgi:hypothetical protein